MKEGGRSTVLFMGTPSFSVPFLDVLLKSGRVVAGVVTQPDRPKGRGQKIIPSSVKEFAFAHNIQVFQPIKLSDPSFIETVKKIAPLYIVVVAYGRIVPSAILRIPERGCINVHASLLPEYRGASPIQWAIIHGRKYTGVTTILMDEGLDTGDILLQERVEIDRSDTAGGLGTRLSEIGVKLLVRTLDGLDRGEIVPKPQAQEKASYSPLLKKEDGLIGWGATSEDIYNKIRGFNPWPGAYTFYKGDRWNIWKAELVEMPLTLHTPGEIADVQPTGIMVAAVERGLKITEVQLEGKKRMGVAEFLRGHRVEKGIILGQEGILGSI